MTMMCQSIDDLQTYIYNKVHKFPAVIAFVGHIGVGKSYIATHLTKALSDDGFITTIASIATPLKLWTMMLAQKTKSNKTIHAQLDLPPKFYTMSSYSFVKDCLDSCKDEWRCLVQCLGAGARNNLHPDIWIELLYDLISNQSSHFILIPDLRYKNEYEFLRLHFNTLCVVKVQVSNIETILSRLQIDRKTYNRWLEHESEKEIDDIPYDILYVND